MDAKEFVRKELGPTVRQSLVDAFAEVAQKYVEHLETADHFESDADAIRRLARTWLMDGSPEQESWLQVANNIEKAE